MTPRSALAGKVNGRRTSMSSCPGPRFLSFAIGSDFDRARGFICDPAGFRGSSFPSDAWIAPSRGWRTSSVRHRLGVVVIGHWV
jgi:hypothetical protein